jgi:hypothetical protein
MNFTIDWRIINCVGRCVTTELLFFKSTYSHLSYFYCFFFLLSIDELVLISMIIIYLFPFFSFTAWLSIVLYTNTIKLTVLSLQNIDDDDDHHQHSVHKDMYFKQISFFFKKKFSSKETDQPFFSSCSQTHTHVLSNYLNNIHFPVNNLQWYNHTFIKKKRRKYLKYSS